MNSGKAPKPPDYASIAAQQEQANIRNAIGSTVMSNADSQGPGGNVRFDLIENVNVDGHIYPRYQRTVNLSDDEKRLYDQENNQNLQLGRIADSQLGRVEAALANPLTDANLPSAVHSVDGYTPANLPGRPQLRTGLGLSEVATGYGQPSRGVQYSPTEFGASPGLQYNFADSGPIQRQIAAVGDSSGTFGEAGPIQRSVGTNDYATQGREIQQALLDRARPEMDRARAALDTQLANQGVARGTEAFTAASDQLARQENDLRLGAILAGGQEQSRLFGVDVARGNFANQAQGAAYEQALGRGMFANADQDRRFAQAASRGQFANDAQGRVYQQGLGRMAAYNDAANTSFGQQQARGLFGLNARGVNNAGQAQEVQQMGARAEFERDSQGINNSARAMQANFENDTAMTGYGMDVDAARYGNEMSQRAFSNNMMRADFQNTARDREVQARDYYRNTPLRDIQTLTSGTQINIPQFAQFKAVTPDPAPIADSAYKSAQLEMEGYKAKSAANAAMMGGIFGGLGSIAGGLFKSDRRLKSEVVDLGVKLPNGLPLYSYGIEGRQEVGVMADEVEAVMPDAVVIMADGFKAVDYMRVLACR